MDRFDFFGVPPIVFGRGTIAQVAGQVQRFGKKPLLVHNGAAADVIGNLLRDAGVEPVMVRQRGEPVVDDVDAGVAAARDGKCDLVIGAGGGSAIDAAKAIAALLGNGGSAVDYMEVVGNGQKITRPAAPWIAIPTTAGTGAEATRNAVIGFPARQFKASIRSELLLPRLAIVDPELARGVPARVTADSGMDAMCQLIESYTSSGASPMTDALALEGVRLAARSLRAAYADGSDLAARTDMALAALLSGITLTNAGLGAVHGFAAPLGANFLVPHGAACAALLSAVLQANLTMASRLGNDHPTLGRYATLGRALTGDPHLKPRAAAEEMVQFVRRRVGELDIAPLSQFGLDESAIGPIVALAGKASSMKFNPVKLTEHTLAAVLRQAMINPTGDLPADG